MIAVFTKPRETELISWVKKAVQMAGLENQQVDVVPLDNRGYLAVRRYVNIIKDAEACIIDLDQMNTVEYTVELSSLGEGISGAVRNASRNTRIEPWLLDPRLMLVTRQTLQRNRIAKYFGDFYSSISLISGFTDELTNGLAAWLKETVKAAVPKVFISYRSAQQAFAERVVNSLRRRGAFVWFDKFNITPGDSIPEAINRGLLWCTHLVLVVDETFFDSRWAKAEVETVLYRHLSGGRGRHLFRGMLNERPLIPLFLVDPNAESIPPLLQRIRGIDCQKEDFGKAMARLWSAITTIGPRL